MSDELLPLPDPGCERNQWPYDGEDMRDYARANVEAATAELRAEVETWKAKTLAQCAEAHEAEARAETLAEALRDARDYVTTELREERERFKGHEHCSNIKDIEADLARIDAALARCKGGSGDER